MKRLSITQLIPGMIVAEDVYNLDHELLIPKGTVLTDKLITKLDLYGILTIFAEDVLPASDLSETESFSNHSTPQAIKALRKGFVDFSIVTTPLYCEHPLQSQRLCSFRDILIGGPSYKDIGFSPKRLRDLQDFPFISLNEGTATRNFYEKYFYQNQLVFSPDMETATTNQILSLVQHDLGIGFCPEALAKDYLDRVEIIEIPVKEHANPRDICLLTDSTRPIGIAWKKLLEILMDSEG